MTPDVPTNGPAFEAMMRAIDSKLANDGKRIDDRALLAVRDVSLKYMISISLDGGSRLPPDLAVYAPLGEAIHRWYQENYGERLMIDPCPGQVVVPIDADLYLLRVPRLFGEVTFVAVREFLDTPKIARGPVTQNIVQLLDGMTPARASRLSDGTLRKLSAIFEPVLLSFYTLESTNHELMYIARGDVATAVAKLMDRSDRYGESKWASLQAAEKVLKAAISLHGQSFKFTHGLKQLNNTAKAAGIDIGDSAIFDLIQCKPGIRYGEEPCSRNEALLAHHASLDLVNRLGAAGANFESGLG